MAPQSLDRGVGDPATQAPASLGQRATRGVVVLAGRGLVVRGVGLLGTVALAHFLTPHEFGLLAVGLAFTTIGYALADGGLGAGLIRRPSPPTRVELRAVLGIQLALGFAIAAVIGVCSIPFDEAGEVTAIMACAVPSLALKTVPQILLERDLSYGLVARAEIANVLAYNAWAVLGVALGWGVWAVATGTVFGAFVSAILLMCSVPSAVLRPSFGVGPIRAVIGFGARFQAVAVVNLVRDQGLNLGIAAFGGTATLGLWSLAWRLLQVPFILFHALWRVSFPAMAQLVATGQDVSHKIERSARFGAIATGIILAPLGAAAIRGVPGLFGPAWRDVGELLPPMAVALAISGPVSVTTGAFLSAHGDVGTVLRNSVSNCAIWLAITLPLVSSLGVIAVIIGWVPASSVEALRLARATERISGARPLRAVLPIAAAATVAGAGGYFVGQLIGDDLSAAVVAALAATVLAMIAVFLVDRRACEEILMRLRHAVRAQRPETVMESW